MDQVVQPSTWTQSVPDPTLWMLHDWVDPITLTWAGPDVLTLQHPECWRFARGFRTSDSHGWRCAPADLSPPFPPPLPGPDVTT